MTVLYSDNQIIATVPDPDDYIPPAWEEARCKSCGALLAVGQITCDYCGTSRKLRNSREE